MEQRVFFSKDEAISILPNDETIHTFTRGPGILIGVDYYRSNLIDMIKSGNAECEAGGPYSMSIDHGLALRYENNLIFINVDNNKLNDLINKKIDENET